jgi:hypothetical protein
MAKVTKKQTRRPALVYVSRIPRRDEIRAGQVLVHNHVRPAPIGILHPKWRGLRIGLMATQKLVDMLSGGCGLVVSDILPLRHEAHERLGVPASWIPKHDTKEERKIARRKLRRHFRRLGFERIGRTPYYGLSTAKRKPSAEDVLKPSEGT